MGQRTILLAGIGFGLAIIGTPPTIIYGQAFTFTFTTFGTTVPITLTESGALPAGVTYTDNGDGTGTLSGTATAVGSFPISLTLLDATRSPVVKSFTLQVIAVSLTASGDLGDGLVGDVVSYAYSHSGGFGAVTFALTSGALPAGLNLSSSGIVTGTRTAAGSDSWQITATDSIGNTSAPLSDSSVTTAPTFYRITHAGDVRATHAGDRRIIHS